MQHHRTKRSLESFKIFPYVAWTVTVLFAIFVYNIATELQDTTALLERQVNALEQKTTQDGRVADFDQYPDKQNDPKQSN